MPPRDNSEEMKEMKESPAYRALEDLAPKSELAEIRRHLSRAPPDLLPSVMEAIKLGTNRMRMLLMGAAAAVYVREALKANSAVGLFPVGIAPGANCAVNTIYPLQPMTSGVTSGAYQFMISKQVFFDLTTSKVDADNGWQFVQNSVRFANDPLAGDGRTGTPRSTSSRPTWLPAGRSSASISTTRSSNS